MIYKSNSKNNSHSKSYPSPNKSIQNSNSKNTHLSSTHISSSYNRPNTATLKKLSEKYDLSHKKTQQNLYSKSKSQASFANSQKKSFATKSTHQQKQSLSRLLQKSACQKHKLWFDHNDQYPFGSQAKAQMPSDIYPEQKWQKSKEEKFQILIQDLRKKHTARFEQKMTKQKYFIEKTCTFLPNKQKVMQSEHNPEIHEKLFQRFKQVQERQRVNQQQKILQQRQRIQSVELQNRKRLNESKKKWQTLLNTQVKRHHYDKLIYERLEQIKNDKKQLIEKLNAKYFMKESPLKNIKINQEQSSQLVKRLCDDYRIQKKQHEAQLEEILKKQINANYPFTPIVNQTDLHRYKINLDHKKTVDENKENFTFVPKIDEMSKIIAQKLNVKIGKHQDHIMFFPERLFHSNEQKREKIEGIAKDLYSKCTFKPHINQISKDLVYVKNYEGQPLNAHKCPLPSAVIQEQKQLTFKPEINSQSKCMTWMEKQSLLMKTKEKSKDKLQKIENQKQYKEMKQCTFHPKTVSTSADWQLWKQNNLKKQKLISVPLAENVLYSDRENPQESSTVKGLTKFMKNCENIKRKKQSHAQRLKQIFNFEQKYDERIKKQRLGLN